MPNTDSLFVGRYQLQKQVGRGGMAAVFLATDFQTRRQVAIKVLSTQPVTTDQFKSRFRQEAKALAQLSHPNIVRVLDYGEVGGRPYLILEWVGGGTLANRMGKPLPYQEAARLILPVARALEYAHECGIIHRDVKPSNVLLTDTGEPRLSDFGIAKSLVLQNAVDLTGPGAGVGTPEYMAPEQGLGQPVDARVDVYSLGVILYELVTGRKPYTADTPLGTMMQASTQPLPRAREIVPDLPEEVERVLFRALAKDPTKRYASMSEFAAVLQKLVMGEKLTQKEAPSIPKAPKQPGKPAPAEAEEKKPPVQLPTWALPAGIGLGVVMIAILVLVLVLKPRGGSSAPVYHLGTLADLQGDVQVIDGTQTAPAQKGELVAKTTHTVLKTAAGRARLGLADGTLVVVDSQASIEFGSPDGTPQAAADAFNVMDGRVLVVMDQSNTKPLNVLLSQKIVTTGIGAIMGLAVDSQGADPQDIDCLAGTCQVSTGGQFIGLSAGQHVHIDATGHAAPADAARTGAWTALYGNSTASPTPAPTTAVPTDTSAPTEIPTQTPTDTPVPVLTLPATLTPILPSATPTGTSTVKPEPTPTRLRPTYTRTPTPTNPPEHPPTNTPVPPTKTPVPPTNTPIPPTNTPRPPTSTPIPPTDTPVPPTDTPVPPPTDTPGP